MSGARLPIILLIALATPLVFSLGPLRLSPYRLVLIAVFAPLLIAFLTGRAGRANAVDGLVFFAAFWALIALTTNHGAAFALETGGIFIVEFLGGYLIGRVCIRGASAFGSLAKAHLFLLLAILPFAAIEAFTSRALLIEGFEAIGRSFANHHQAPRLGLERAQVVFEHPILYGVFAISGLGAIFHLWSGSALKTVLAYGIGALSALFSVSTGAIVGLVVQSFFIGWNRALRMIRARWKLLTALAAVGYAAVDAISDRTPFHVFVEYLTLNSGTAYNRILIFEFGMAEVARHPIFGIGHHDWARPPWMSDSFDNFWLLNVMRYGAPMGLALILAVALLIRRVARRSFRDEGLRASQAGFLTSLAGLIVAGATVHFWNASFVWVMCFIGAGAWLMDRKETAPAPEADQSRPAPPPRFRSLGREAPRHPRTPSAAVRAEGPAPVPARRLR